MDKKFQKFTTTLRQVVETIIPILFGVFVIITLYGILFNPNPRTSLGGNAERQIIRQSLKLSGGPKANSEKIVVVSLKDSDKKYIERVSDINLQGASIETYGKIMKKIYEGVPELVVLHWIQRKEDFEDKAFEPLFQAMKSKSPDTDIWIPYSLFQLPFLSPKLKKTFKTILEADHCAYPVIQSICSYNKEWGSWIPQAIGNRFWIGKDTLDQKELTSENLPHHRPSVILNLTNPKNLTTYSFSEILSEGFNQSLLKDKIILIGNDISQPAITESLKHSIDDSLKIDALSNTVTKGFNVLFRRLYSPLTDENIPLYDRGGIPYHVFWATYIQMYLDQETINVVPKSPNYIVTFTLCLILFLLLFNRGILSALNFLIFTIIGLILLNPILIKIANTYFPVVPSMYWVFITFTFFSFLQMSLAAYTKWRAMAQQRLFEIAADIRGNFAAIMSHNLNTHIAAMLTLSDILKIYTENKNEKKFFPFSSIDKYITKCQLGVRGISIGSIISDDTINNSNQSVNRFYENFSDVIPPTLKRLGINLSLKPLDDFEEKFEYLNLPIKIDPNALRYALANLVILSKPADTSILELTLEMNLILEDNLEKLVFKIESTHNNLENIEDSPLNKISDEDMVWKLSFEEFWRYILFNQLKSIINFYKGKVSFHSELNQKDYIIAEIYPK